MISRSWASKFCNLQKLKTDFIFEVKHVDQLCFELFISDCFFPNHF